MPLDNVEDRGEQLLELKVRFSEIGDPHHELVPASTTIISRRGEMTPLWEAGPTRSVSDASRHGHSSRDCLPCHPS
jgi:hypothetical protein